jgi:hypothetical protein
MKKMMMLIFAGIIVVSSFMAGKINNGHDVRTARFYPVKSDTLPTDTTHHPRDTTMPKLNDYIK